MERRIVQLASETARAAKGIGRSRSRLGIAVGILAPATIFFPQCALADEGGISFWAPGFFGSLAAAPQQPGWSLANIYYHTSVSAGSNVALAREFQIGRIPANLTATLNANVKANADLGFVIPSYVFGTPVLGGQAAVAVAAAYGRVNSTLEGTLTGTINGIPFGPRSDSITSTLWGFSDLIPQFSLRWNSGVNNYMTYLTGDIPVGAYDSSRLSNTGIGHGAIDGGGGYTYFNPQTGNEFSAVLGFTYNFTNTSTQYQNGVDMHLDWGASHFVTQQLQVGLVGYAYKQLGCDSGSGNRVGCFQSQVLGIGPQLGFIFPVGDKQGYLNFKAYKEFAAENRPEGWNAWVTFVISPAAPTPGAPAKRMIVK
jgi:hypothetical protein